ncbi:hypothetical protein RF679_01200 [Undibacterium cyanobacteriorum]|uniref:Lipoprotein n=1 Tax=Undibacterium cyanobacteriorum TaxID=3073561 RepID=A0ABY9RI69_9BURK|nr:hypothetical protein [Undibacterium sp. 20NA77.5]WMW80913.1 hypothetical protein RF679_01200 [Undibacterium sp. 20NA77.5]
MMKRLSLIAASSMCVLLAGCVVPMTGTYPAPNTQLGEVQDWRMPLYREPGRIDVKLRVVKGSSTQVALETNNEVEQAPIQVLFGGSSSSNKLESSVRYSTESGVFAFKYFGKTLDRNSDVNLRIEWDENMRVSVTVDGEVLQVKPHTSFGKLRLFSKTGSIEVKEVKYEKMADAAENKMGAE